MAGALCLMWTLKTALRRRTACLSSCVGGVEKGRERLECMCFLNVHYAYATVLFHSFLPLSVSHFIFLFLVVLTCLTRCRIVTHMLP